jgi:Na+/melibiose symporter-like transporter
MTVGYLGDRITTSTLGKRKPFIIASYVVYASGFLCYANPPVTNTLLIDFWYLIFFSIMNIGTYISAYPFAAWMYELSADENDFGNIIAS